MVITMTLIIFCIFAMVIFILAFAGVLHIVLVKTINYGLEAYFVKRKKFFDDLEKEAIALRTLSDSNIH